MADEALPSSRAWAEASERRAEHELRVAYAGGIVTIPAGARYYADGAERVLLGWHGTYECLGTVSHLSTGPSRNPA